MKVQMVYLPWQEAETIPVLMYSGLCLRQTCNVQGDFRAVFVYTYTCASLDTAGVDVGYINYISNVLSLTHTHRSMPFH